jgi:indole-3-glycerol phosphate synthase
MTILDRILATKRDEVAERRARLSVADLHARAAAAGPPRGFRRALDRAPGYGLIAEIKRASPSKGLIRPDYDPPAHARAYAAGGATCLSILTDEQYFQGADEHFAAARAAVPIPAIRKDFVVDPWQVLEARALGADAILLIMAALDDAAAADVEAAALDLGMDVLVEVHDRAEMDRTAGLRSRLIGVNNRDLRDFTVSFDRTYELVAHAPPGCTFVAESGLGSHADLAAMAEHGVRCFLVGESLMRRDDLTAATRDLLGTA